jgi:hypothetical protein
MMTTRETSSENDVLHRFALGYEHPDARLLDEFVRCYPEHADALTTLAIELALEQLEPEEPAVTEPAPLAATSAAMVERAMSRFQNRLFEVRRAAEEATAPSASARGRAEAASSARDIFAARTPDEIKIIIVKVDASPLFFMRLRDRGIDADTIPPGFIRCLSEAMNEPEEAVRAHLAGPAQVQSRTRFKSEGTPTAGRKITFQEAVRSSSDLTPEQQARLLAY